MTKQWKTVIACNSCGSFWVIVVNKKGVEYLLELDHCPLCNVM